VSPIDDPGILFTKKNTKHRIPPPPRGGREICMIVDFE